MKISEDGKALYVNSLPLKRHSMEIYLILMLFYHEMSFFCRKKATNQLWFEVTCCKKKPGWSARSTEGVKSRYKISISHCKLKTSILTYLRLQEKFLRKVSCWWFYLHFYLLQIWSHSLAITSPIKVDFDNGDTFLNHFNQ